MRAKFSCLSASRVSVLITIMPKIQRLLSKSQNFNGKKKILCSYILYIFISSCDFQEGDHLIPKMVARLYMLRALQVVFENALDILSIKPVSRMWNDFAKKKINFIFGLIKLYFHARHYNLFVFRNIFKTFFSPSFLLSNISVLICIIY